MAEVKNIFEKLLAITSEIGNVNKNLVVGEGKAQYKAVGEADVLKAVKELEKKYGIYSYPYDRKIVDSSILQTEKEFKGEVKRGNQIFLRLETTYRFVNTEKPEEFIDIKSYGDGVDTQDKAPGKAITYSDKYALLKAYKMITGDDPDQNASPENMKIEGQTVTNKVTDAEAKSIYSLMIRKGLNVVELLKKNYGISNTADLTKEQYLSIFKAVNGLPDKEQKNKKEIEQEHMEMYADYMSANADMGDR